MKRHPLHDGSAFFYEPTSGSVDALRFVLDMRIVRAREVPLRKPEWECIPILVLKLQAGELGFAETAPYEGYHLRFNIGPEGFTLNHVKEK